MVPHPLEGNTMTSEHHKVLAAIKVAQDERMKHAMSTLQRTQSRAHEQMELLSRVTAQFLATGIADLTDADPIWDLDYHYTNFGHKGWKWHRYIRDVAKEAGRPYCTTAKAKHGRYLRRNDNSNEYISQRYLWITKRKYTQPLVSMFMLVGDCAQVTHDTRHWNITLEGTDGEDAFATWRNECASNPGYLKALKLIK
jgi:hypothetical protein